MGPPQNGGESAGTDVLMLRLYDEVRKLAHARLRHQRTGARMQTTEVVHEVYLKLSKGGATSWESRAHFFGSAARAMKQVLIDLARRSGHFNDSGESPDRLAAPQASEPKIVGEMGVSLDLRIEGRVHSFTIEDLARHLQDLDAIDPRRVDVVVCKFFAGMDEGQIAHFLDVSVRTVQRDWHYARAWLGQRLMSEAEANGH